MTYAATERLLAEGTNPNVLSQHQREAAVHEGNVFVDACPGAGKSRLIGFRIASASIFDKEQRIAATSFTNAPVQVMLETAQEVGVQVGPPHFIGTIHQFLLKYVLYPFGHLILGCRERPRIIDANDRIDDTIQIGPQSNQRVSPGEFIFEPNGTLTVRDRAVARFRVDPWEAADRGGNHALAVKQRLGTRGLVYLDDTMHYCRRVLADYEWVRTAIARRFDEVIVDEFQDTSETQIRTLQSILDAGLRSIYVAGDLDQAIYEFGRGNPDVAREFIIDNGLSRVGIDENYRCAQALCNVAWHLSTRQEPNTAVGPTGNEGLAPELFVYPAGEPQPALSWFGTRLEELGISEASARVVARDNELVDLLNAQRRPAGVSSRVWNLIQVAASLESGNAVPLNAAKSAERLISTLAWGQEPPVAIGESLRAATGNVLFSLPPLDWHLDSWVSHVRDMISAELRRLVNEPARRPGQNLRVPSDCRQIPARRFARPSGAQPGVASTVHAVKGETYDAILLVDRSSQGGTTWWVTPPGNVPDEETRIRFVALTRARRYVGIAVANDAPNELLTSLQGFGCRRSEHRG